MGKPFKIGKKEYKFKKDAITHYRSILNSYDFGQTLNQSDFDDLLALLDYAQINYLGEYEMADNDENIEGETTNEYEMADIEEINEGEISIEEIKIAKVQFNTKCFEIFYSDKTSEYISYIMMINNTKYTLEKLFYIESMNKYYEEENRKWGGGTNG